MSTSTLAASVDGTGLTLEDLTQNIGVSTSAPQLTPLLLAPTRPSHPLGDQIGFLPGLFLVPPAQPLPSPHLLLEGTLQRHPLLKQVQCQVPDPQEHAHI